MRKFFIILLAAVCFAACNKSDMKMTNDQLQMTNALLVRIAVSGPFGATKEQSSGEPWVLLFMAALYVGYLFVSKHNWYGNNESVGV